MDHNGGRVGWFGFKGIIGVAVVALVIGATLYGTSTGIAPLQKPVVAATDRQAHKPVRAMNLALGPMVFFARDLDFSVKNAKGEKLDPGRNATRIETQLQGLRELYRQEAARNPKLAGSMTLQFNVSAAGDVSQVKETAGRINDSEFKKAVVAEIAKWHLADLVSESVTVQIPLLFVQEGMDITTLLRWESGFAGAGENVVNLPAGKAETPQPTKAVAATATPAANAKPAPAADKPIAPALKSEAEEVQIKYATLLRKEPNFNSPVVATFTIGTKVNVVSRSNEWLQVQPQHSGPSGYIRKEFVVPVDVVINR